MKRKIPKTNKAWCNEIIIAYDDAVETIPFGPITGSEIKAEDLYLLAPHICIKFRGIKATEQHIKLASDAALCTVIAVKDNEEGILDHPFMAFSLSYLASNCGLSIISESILIETMTYIENNLDTITEALKELHPHLK